MPRIVNPNVKFLRLLKNLSFVLLLLIAPGLVEAVLGQNQPLAAPDQVVKSFYRFHLSHDKNFLKKNVRVRKQWLSPTLYQLLITEFRREEEYAKANPKESFVPYMEGDPFTNSQEYPTTFRVGHTEFASGKATVTVTMLWKPGRSQKGVGRNLEIQLVQVNGRWLIDNVVNKTDGDDLVENLKREKYLP